MAQQKVCRSECNHTYCIYINSREETLKRVVKVMEKVKEYPAIHQIEQEFHDEFDGRFRKIFKKQEGGQKKMNEDKTYKGNVVVNKENSKEWEQKLKDIWKISGYLSIDSNTELKADALKNVGGYLYINSNAELKADALKSVGGNLYINSNAELKALKNVGGSIYIYKEAKVSANIRKLKKDKEDKKSDKIVMTEE